MVVFILSEECYEFELISQTTSENNKLNSIGNSEIKVPLK